MKRLDTQFLRFLALLGLLALIAAPGVMATTSHPAASATSFPQTPPLLSAPALEPVSTSPTDPSALYATIAAGYRHTCALTTGGGVQCWGENLDGQLGDGTTTRRAMPVSVSGLASGVSAIAAGNFHTCALMTGGGVKCWGANGSGQLGDGSTSRRSAPVAVSGLAGDVTAIATGGSHTCALMVDGSLKCWGSNYFGHLGDGTTANRSLPVDVTGLAGGVSAVSTGEYFTCALMTTGGVKCWGYNDTGQLGDGTTTNRALPTDVSGLLNGVASLTCGKQHACVLMADGGAKCWGANFYGQLGDAGAYSKSTTPVAVTVLSGGISALFGGDDYTCALTTGGALRCWGDNSYGQLGDGTTETRRMAVDVTGLGSGVSALAAGYDHACAITASGARCWGKNSHGQAGNGKFGYVTVPGDVGGLATGASSIATAGNHTCALVTGNGVKCWGFNYYGQLGDGTKLDRALPVNVSGLTSGVSAVAGGISHTCALTGDGGVKCWGYNYYGQLGDGHSQSQTQPVDVQGLTNGVAAITAGGLHTCVLMTSGDVKCWGYNAYGQLGDGTTTNRHVPVDVATSMTAIAAGDNYTCGLTTGGGVKCWGRNASGQLGDGETTDSHVPVDVSELANGVNAIATGGNHACALTTSGGAKCWGANNHGQVGDGTTTGRPEPVDVSGLANGVSAITAGANHSCALTTGDGFKCWGQNDRGQLGNGTIARRTVPTDVQGLMIPAAGMDLGESHTCARSVAGAVQCWGENLYGQLGNGEFGYYTTPVDVITPLVLHLPLVLR